MSSRTSRDRSPYQDSSPTTPSSPITPSTLPQWLRHTRPRSGILASVKFRVLAAAFGCIALGWMLTSILGPDDGPATLTAPYDVASGGVLEDPTGFGGPTKSSQLQPGILGGEAPEDDEFDDAFGHQKSPSVTGALSELHDAVKYKLKSWNPYFANEPTRVSTNATSSSVHRPARTTSGLYAGEAVTEGFSEDQRLGGRTRIGKCTILFNGNSFWERAIRTHERHDREHGYRLHVLRQPLMDDVWSKPAYILSLLLRELAKPESERLEWLFWVDADTVILNPYIPIEVFLPPPGTEFEDVHLMYSNDWNGLNNGVFPIRVSQWSVQLFSAITSFRHYRPDADLTFRDQSAMDQLMHEPEFVKNVVQTPQRWFNAYQGEHNETLAPFQIRRGDFLVHFAGVPNREERMGYWLERAEQHLDDWEVPVKSTSYHQEVKDFWAEQKDLRKNKKEALGGARVKAKDLMTKVAKQVEDYGDRLSEEQSTAITADREALHKILEDEKLSADMDKMEEAVRKLEESSLPLATIIYEVHKALLSSAHQAIFAGEKDLLESGYEDGVFTPDSPQLQQISEGVQKLKALVMTPQEEWNRHDITAATDTLTQARATYHANLDAAQAEADQIEQSNKQAAKALSEAQKQVEAEAAAAGVGPSAGLPAGYAAQTSALGAVGVEEVEYAKPAGQPFAAVGSENPASN